MIHTFNRFSFLPFNVFDWQWCGTDANYCGSGCQNGPCTSGPSPPSTSPPPPTGFNYNVNHGEDSRLIGYVNWQACPTPGKYDAYSHMVVASQYLILGRKLRINVIHSVPSLRRCPFATMRITSPLSIRGGLLGRRSFSVSAALAWEALGLVSLDNFCVSVDQKRCFISRS